MGVLPGVVCPPAGTFRKALPLVSARVVQRVRRAVFPSRGLAVPSSVNISRVRARKAWWPERGGIFSGMKSTDFPSLEEVLTDLGDDLIERLSAAVYGARDDYRRHRAEHPDWAADETGRGSANFIHDRIWAHLHTQLDGIDDVTFADNEPTRQLGIGSRYVIRVKRHREHDCVRSYPTGTAWQFWSGDPAGVEALPGMRIVPLALGYRWDAEAKLFGSAVLSYRTDMDKPVWVAELEETPAETGATTLWRPVGGPSLPDVDLSSILPEIAVDGQEGA